MFFKLILENSNSDRIDMTTTANQYMTSRVEGLDPPTGTISTSSYAGMDGSYLNNAFIEKRNVVISFEMRGVGVEARRHQLYKVVKPSRYIKIYYATAGIDVFAEGYVESCASGYLAAVSMAARLEGRPVPDFGTMTAIGALAHYVSDSTVASFQPMNVNFGIIAPLEQRVRGKANKNLAIANRSLAHLEAMEK